MLSWPELQNELEKCKKCSLYLSRIKVVIGRGNKNADILLIGEGPGAEEDITGEAFVGAAGKLLDNILCATGFEENDVYIANIVKCRPPGNRIPSFQEAEACFSFLRNQAFLVKPKIIVCLGSTAAKYIFKDMSLKITAIRGKIKVKSGFHYMPTYHPAALFRDNTKKVDMYTDLKKVKILYDELKENDS